MTKMKLLLTICLLTGSIALVSVHAMAKNNPKPTSGSTTITQGPTGPGNSPTPRPTTTTGVSLR
ncbi:MAG: hypothetical protein LAP21_16095 [Acidobacteriia bacterium]|nr:hypothetical protein [Terriglobia bacterium]